MNNSDDLIDSRDVIARIEELQDEINEESVQDLGDPAYTPIENDELTALTALADEASGSPDWEFGETLIRDSYFAEYAEDFAHECGLVNTQASDWPNNYIDWERAAEELQVDYFEVDFDGETYWIRA